jgi:hypothetical protein
MMDEKDERYAEERGVDPELVDLFEDVFACPLCGHKPLKFFEAYFEPSVPDVLFIMFCRRCQAEVQYSMSGDTIEETKEDLLKARVMAALRFSQFKAVTRRDDVHRASLKP